MILPTKYEKMNDSPLVIGSYALRLLKKKSYDPESLFQELRRERSFSLDQFLDVLTFLRIVEAIDLVGHSVTIKKR
jgi:hypothetical protein